MSAKLSPTSAMVLLFASEKSYKTPQARQLYCEQDLSSGRRLFDRLNTVSPLFSDVVKNRKHTVSSFIQQALERHPIQQVCLAAAGQDPIGVDVAVQHPELRVFEIDAALLKNKQQWARQQGVPNLFCVQSDLCQAEQVRQQLLAAGWQAQKPSCWVFEGIVYYITVEHLQNLLNTFKPTACVVDYVDIESNLGPQSDEVKKIMNQVWHCIEEETGQPLKPTYYNPNQLENVFKKSFQKLYGLSDMQKKRTGHSEPFDFLANTPWLHVAWC